MKSESSCRCCDPRAAAVALVRWCLGLIFFFAGIGKFADPGGFANNLAQQYQKTWLPPLLVSLFARVLPFWEVIVGALLLLGLFRNSALFATGVLLILLVFGQALAGNGAVVFYNTGYLFMTAAVLFLGDYDDWVLFPRPLEANPPPAALP